MNEDLFDTGMKKLRLCVIGNMLGRNLGYVTTQGQILADLLTAEGLTVVNASSKINKLLRLIDIASTLIRSRKRIDMLVVEVYSGLNIVVSETVGFLGRLLGLPMIFVLHGGNLHRLSEKHPHNLRRVLARANLLVAPSPFLAKIFRGQGYEVRVIRNIVDLKAYSYRLRTTVSPKLIWMRAFHEIYNPQMAIEVFASVKKMYPQASLVMAGVDKGLKPEIKNMVEDMGLSDSVRFPGFLDHDAKTREFSKADIFVNTNHIDNMPVSVIEAGAMGLPVVATCVGGIPDMITNGQNGLLVPDGDVKGMADAVVSLLENTELAARLSANGRRFAEMSSWETVKPQWEALFDEIILKQKGHEIVDCPVDKAATQ